MPKKLEASPAAETASRFHCSAEWHFSRFTSSRAAALIHPWALRISKNTGKFSVSATQAANHFNISRSTASRAYTELHESGFFKLLEYGQFDSNVYEVLTHKEWCKAYPDQCVIREELPWTAENDPLGSQLWAVSGGKVKFKQFQIDLYRQFSLPDNEIVAVFKEWREGVGRWRQARNVPKHFLKHLRVLDGEGAKVLS